ncbi:MAG TPA: hypothetical protein VFT66_15030 [Roseiflexaceae bacterium]|nr:hypothetical protein [Roseiflexaceae bacterium]
MRRRLTSIMALLITLLCSACGVQTTAAPQQTPDTPLLQTAATMPSHAPVATPALAPTQPVVPVTLLAYVHAGDVWISELPGAAPRRVSSDGEASAPRWSPSGAWLAFCQNEQLQVVPRDGGATQAFGPCSGTWLPTRDELAFATDSSTTIVDVASGRRRAVAYHVDAWNPDGTAFAYVDLALSGALDTANAPERTTSLWRAAADGSTPQELFSPGTPAPYGLVLAGWYNNSILFWSDPQFSASLLADGVPLHSIPAQGGSEREIVPWMLAHPDFLAISPDGTRIAATEGGNRQTWTNKHIVTVDMASGTRTQITGNAVAAFSPTWSPDGKQLAYVAGPDVGSVGGGEAAQKGMEQRHIWVMNADGSDNRQITTGDTFYDERPRWTADGAHLVFVRVNDQQQPSLWTVRPDGSGLEQISDSLGNITQTQEADFGYYGYHNWDQFFDVWQPSANRAFSN